MKKIKIITMIIAVLMLCGCTTNEEYYNKNTDIIFFIHTDKETCVEYFVSIGVYNKGNMFVRYNADGSIKLNQECLNGK